MNCRKVKRQLSLYIGEDLSLRRQQAIEGHLRSCAACQNEHSQYLRAVGQTRQWLQRQELHWEESAWKQVVTGAVPREKDPGKALWPWPFKPTSAYALMIFLAAGLTLLVVRPAFVPSNIPGEILQTAGITDPGSLSGTEPGSQDVVAITLVSRETGLKVQWFFNRNFNLEEDTE